MLPACLKISTVLYPHLRLELGVRLAGRAVGVRRVLRDGLQCRPPLQQRDGHVQHLGSVWFQQVQDGGSCCCSKCRASAGTLALIESLSSKPRCKVGGSTRTMQRRVASWQTQYVLHVEGL